MRIAGRSGRLPNNTLVPTRKGEAPLLAAQRGRWAMKSLVCSVSTLLLLGCSTGPHLGKVTNVVVGELTIANSEDAGICSGFKLTPREARAFLNRAILVTPLDLHHGYYTSPCSIRGTAEFRGRPGSWEIGVLGTGVVILQGEFRYVIADPKQEDHEG